MLCKYGHENPDEAKFCGQCGIPLDQSDDSSVGTDAGPHRGSRKKIWAVIVVMIAAIGALICFLPKESPAEPVIEAIDAIGMVSLDSLAKIKEAEELYDVLDSAYKEEVSNIDVLHQARTAYDDLLKEKRKKDASEGMDTVVDLVLSGEYRRAKLRFADNIKLIEEDTFVEKLGVSVVQKIYAEAQKQYENADYWRAIKLLEHCTDFSQYCTDAVLEEAKVLLDAYTAEMVSKTPENGEILDRTQNPGRNTFTIKADKYDVCFKLELADNPEKYIIVYVKANESVRLNILNGKYVARYTEGPMWFGKEQMFGPDATYYSDSEIMETAGYTSTDAIHWNNWTYTIYSGNFGYQNMNPEDF